VSTLHETPPSVAAALAAWAPSSVSRILEPAVGSGALLRPLVSRIESSCKQLVCVDVDGATMASVGAMFDGVSLNDLRLLTGDFLSKEREDLLGYEELGFDCIVMNPPFAARSNKRAIIDPGPLAEPNSKARMVPIEAAFVFRAVQLLSLGGTMLSIVPSSVIAGVGGRWLRRYLLENGRIVCVHELPQGTFDHVEARVYFLVFVKGSSSASVLLLNHELVCPDELWVECTNLGSDARLDYSFYESRRWLLGLRGAWEEGNWVELAGVADVRRGTAESPLGAQRAIHTTDFRNGFWRTSRFSRSKSRSSARDDRVKRGDILLMRVGRQAYNSVGCIQGRSLPELTDCVLRLTPRCPETRDELLFSLRSIIACPQGRNLVQRGSGAPYIVSESLKSIELPMSLPAIFPNLFSQYRAAIELGNFPLMQRLETEVRTRLSARVENK
jgi:tRNA1(Val) A37 N6-methylase TrmN6